MNVNSSLSPVDESIPNERALGHQQAAHTQALIQQLDSRDRNVREAAEAEICKLWPVPLRAVASAFKAASNECMRRSTQGLLLMIATGPVAFIAMAVKANGAVFPLILIGVVIPSLLGQTKPRSYMPLLRLLTNADHIEAIEPLVDMLTESSPKLRRFARQELIRLLPILTRKHRHLISDLVLWSLSNQFRVVPRDKALLQSIVQVFGELGGKNELDRLRQGVKTVPRDCLDSACRKIEKRLEEDKPSTSLLRPADEPIGDALLRPAGATETDEQLLLRPTNSGEIDAV